MIQLKCKICGGSVIQTADGYVCDSCGTPVSVFDMTDDKKIESMNRANEARRTFDYDEAVRAYTQILAQDPNNAEAHWNLALSKFGIEYESEMTPSGGIKFKPNIHRLRNDSFDKDPNYRKAMLNADDNALGYYMSEGKILSAMQAKLMELVRTEKDYDVFISFKAEDGMGSRTRDSLIAQQIYEQLTARGIRTFFSRITLQNVTGDEYEPHIFAALNSARVMVLVGTDLSYINYGWVKNEWTRYLDLMEEDAGKGKTLIPVYETLPPQMFPKRIPMREAVDFSGKDAMLELVHGITNILGKKDSRSENAQADLLVKKAQEALDQGQFSEVIRNASEATELAPNHAEAWFLLFMAENRVIHAEDLARMPINWTDSRYFDRAYEQSRGLRRQVLDDVKAAYAREQERLRKDANAAAQAELAKEHSRHKVEQAKTQMRAGSFSKALELLNDNVILSSEVNELRSDCELGIEYEKIDKHSYLIDQLTQSKPDAVKALQSMASAKKIRTTPMDAVLPFGNDRVTLRLISSALTIFGLVTGYIGVTLSRMLGLGTYLFSSLSAVGSIGMIILVWVAVSKLFEKIDFTDNIFIRAGVILFGMFLISGISEAAGPLMYVLMLVLAALFLLQALNDSRKLSAKSDEKAGTLYNKELKPLEDALISDYRQKFKKLTNYTQLEQLTTVLDYIRGKK